MANFEFFDRAKVATFARLVRQVEIIDPASDDYHLIAIPRNGFVTNIIMELVNPFGTTTAMTVGFSGNKETADPDAFMLSVDIDPDGANLFISLASATGINRGGKWFPDAGGMITVAHTKGNAAATASFRLWAEYITVY